MRRVVVLGLVALVAGVLALVERHALCGWLLTRGASFATGQRVSVGGFHIGLHRSVFEDVEVTTPAGDPVFAAGRIVVDAALPALLTDRAHRYGIRGIAIDRPVFSVVRHRDGSYSLGHAGAGAGAPAAGSAVPWAMDVRVSDGEIRLIDRAPVAADLGQQRFVRIELRALVDSGRRSTLTGSAQYVGRQTAASPIRTWPLHIGGTVDYPRGVALLRLGAAELPLRGAVGFLQHSPAVRVDDGVLHRCAVTLFALDIATDRAGDVHIGGAADLVNGRLAIAALRRPVIGLRGRLTLVDDGIWSTRLDGTLSGVPIVGRGGAFDRLHPVLRLGVRGAGELAAFRHAFAFSDRQPVAGAFHIQTVLEAPVSNLLIRSQFEVSRGAYGAVPLANIRGRVDYHASTVVLGGVEGRYGSSSLELGGRFLLGGRALDSALAVGAESTGGAVPYAENLAPEARIEALALITGTSAGYRARGAIGARGADLAGMGMFDVDERGVGEFGPFALTRSDGSSVIGALRLERPRSVSAAWISARRYRVTVPRTAARLAGLRVAAFPAVAGVLDADLAGAGPPSGFALTGMVSGSGVRVGNAQLGNARTVLGGNLGDVRLADLRVGGPLGRFAGSAAVAGGLLGLAGTYDGSLQGLVPLTGNQQAYGAVRGPVLATLHGLDVTVQSPRADLRGGRVRGVALQSAAGTIAVRGGRFHLIAGSGRIGGRQAVAAESAGTIAVSAPDIPSSALADTGLPLQAGNVSAYGVADLRGARPDFDGTVTVAGGRARGYVVTGDARLDLDGTRLRIFAATGALGSTYGAIGGLIDGVGTGPLSYDLDAAVALGDVELLRHDLSLPVRELGGSFSARLHVHGSGTRPYVEGRAAVPEGTFHGLAFRDAAADLVLDPDGIAVRDGRMTVGSTTAALAASASGGAFGFAARARAADLADFNDFFDASDTLGGRGSFDIALRTYGRHVTTRGQVAMTDVRIRDFPVGTAGANWAMRGTTIAGRIAAGSAAGSLAASAAIAPVAGTDLRNAFHGADYDVRAAFRRLDLGTWIQAGGSSAPVLGHLDADLRVAGRFPRLALQTDATLTAGAVRGVAIPRAHLTAAARGSRITVASADADLGFAMLSGSGRLGLGPSDPLSFDVRVTTPDVSEAARLFVPASRGLDLAGALDSDVRLTGTFAKPIVQGGFDLRDARYGGFIVPRTIGQLALAGKAIELRDADVEFSRGQAFVAGSLPLTLQPFGLGPPRAPLSFDVTARSVDLAQFAPLLPAGTRLGGTLDGRFGVEGTVERPRLLGSLALTGGSYASPFERAPIQNLSARLAFEGTSIGLQTFHAGVGGGTLDGNGRLTLPIGAGSRVRLDAALTARAAQLDFPAYGRGTVDGSLRLTGGATARPLLAGDVALRNAVVPVSAVYGTGAGASGAAGIGPLAILNPAFQIHAVAGDNVRIRNAIVDIGVRGSVDVGGSLHSPTLAGGFTATGGTISSYNHLFRIVNAAVTFNPADGIVPTVSARAVSRVNNPDPDPSRNIAGSANIIVTVSGTADSNNLQVTYSSEPAYSQAQIIGLLLDVPALLGAVNFNLNGGTAGPVLRGAPGETNALLPPGVTPEQVSAVSFNQEVFSLLNGQFTQHALGPLYAAAEKTLGLSDIQLTVDYGGGLGYSLRRQIGQRDFYAFLSQTVSYPERANIGFELTPKAYESLDFSLYQQNGVTSLITNQTPGQEFLSPARRLTAVQPLGNRSGFEIDLSRRF